MSDEQPESDKKQSKYLPARWVGSPNVEKIQGQFLAVLKREAQQLLDESHKGKLSFESSKILINYLKLINEFNKPKGDVPPKPTDGQVEEPDVFSELSDDELKKMAAKPK